MKTRDRKRRPRSPTDPREEPDELPEGGGHPMNEDEMRRKKLEEVLDRVGAELSEHADRYIIGAVVDHDDTSGTVAIRGNGNVLSRMGLLSWMKHKVWEAEKG